MHDYARNHISLLHFEHHITFPANNITKPSILLKDCSDTCTYLFHVCPFYPFRHADINTI